MDVFSFLHARATVFEGCLADFFVAGMLEIRYSVKPPSIPGSSKKKEEPGVKRMGNYEKLYQPHRILPNPLQPSQVVKCFYCNVNRLLGGT